MADPPTLGFVVEAAGAHEREASSLAKEIVSTLGALHADALRAPDVPAEADFVITIVAPDAGLPSFPDLKDKAAAALGIASDEAEARAAAHAARKQLRAAGATLGALQVAFTPDMFGVMGLESDGVRERLHILLETLVHDAERLRLKREGWEEPDE